MKKSCSTSHPNTPSPFRVDTICSVVACLVRPLLFIYCPIVSFSYCAFFSILASLVRNNRIDNSRRKPLKPLNNVLLDILPIVVKSRAKRSSNTHPTGLHMSIFFQSRRQMFFFVTFFSEYILCSVSTNDHSIWGMNRGGKPGHMCNNAAVCCSISDWRRSGPSKESRRRRGRSSPTPLY